jgi:hypothetical protein
MREAGFYWVAEHEGKEPEVALFSQGVWYVTGYDLDTDVFRVLSERLVPPARATPA